MEAGTEAEVGCEIRPKTDPPKAPTGAERVEGVVVKGCCEDVLNADWPDDGANIELLLWPNTEVLL